jgi:hypothetical protein
MARTRRWRLLLPCRSPSPCLTKSRQRASLRLTHQTPLTSTADRHPAGSADVSLPRALDEAVQIAARVKVTCVTPLGEEVASIS